MPALTAGQLAELCGGRLEGAPDRLITGANVLEHAGPTDLAFASGKTISRVPSSLAACILVPDSFEGSMAGQGPTGSLIRVRDPRSAFARALAELYPVKRFSPAVHPTAIVALTASVESDCFIGPYVTIGEHTKIASRCVIGGGANIGDDVLIGDDTVLDANVVIYDRVRIGARVVVHAGAVIGADGFGFTLAGDHYEKFPQVGSVEIGDDVEIGANCCIDRAALGATRIGDGTKLDNLVHIAHNCVLGKHVVVAAQTGFSGSVTVGDYAVIGGQVGVGEKAKIESKAVVGGKAGILPSHIVHAGEPVWGIPARPLRQHLKNLAHVSRIAELREEIRELREKIAELEAD